MAAKSKSSKIKGASVDGKSPSGYLPCFSQHLDSRYPLDDFYRNKAFIAKVAHFLSVVVTAEGVHQLKNLSAAKDIAKVKPDSLSGKNIIQACRFAEGELYRADWGNCPYRLVFGLDTKDRRCYIFMLDAKHKTHSGKNYR